MEAQGCPDFDGAGLGLRWATCSGYAGLLANLADDLGPSARSSRVIRPLRLPLATPMVLSRVLDTSIDIDAPPQRVWDVLLDLRAWQEWNPFIPFITGTPDVGSRLRLKVVLPGRKPMEFKPEVFVVRAPEEIVWGGNFLQVVYRGDHAILLEPLPSGGTRFRQRERFRGPMVLFMTNMIKDTEGGYHRMNRALKQRVEARER